MCFLAYVVPTKICSRCKDPQPWDNFTLDRTKPDGMNYICRVCDSLKQRAGYQRNHEHKLLYNRGWTKKHRARILRRRRARYWQNPEKYRLAARLFGQEHRATISAREKQQRLADPEKYRRKDRIANALRKGKLKTWRRANLVLICLYAANRRARQRQLPDTFTVEEQAFMMQYWHHACAICGNEAGLWWTLANDHWIPITSPDCPGTVADNMLPLCHGTGGCNNSKCDKEPLTWLSTRVSPRDAKRILKAIDTYFAIVRMQRTQGAAD